MNPYLLFILAALAGAYALERIAEALDLRRLSPDVPEEFRGAYDPERYRRSQEYLRARTRFSIAADTLTTAFTVAFILLGGFGFVDRLARGFESGPIGTGLLFFGVLGLGNEFLGLPLSVYHTFVIEARFGFNKTTPRTFVLDLLKGWALAALLGGALGSILLKLFGEAGPGAWLWCWGAATAFSLGVAFLAPVLLLPLFNRFTPLPEGELRSALEALARREGFRLSGVFTMDGSRRSTKGNAFFTGFGRTRRIALYDTLVSKHPGEEIAAILAHEIGHCRKRHVPIGMAISVLLSGFMLFLLSRFLNNRELFDAFQVADLSVHASLTFFGFLYAPLGLILSLPRLALSRRFEREADEFAARACGSGVALAAALRRLSADNLSNLTPHPFGVFLHHGHPPVLERIRFLQGLPCGESS
ncbi:MAG: peptidase M48 [Elusimicrobia bacterium GWA2_69_24]|nr:MAG: peptidase M48 [Elusimicrobia bacterium GWA2_69_24]HBL16706.1 peptidase M48 [Elusimicrobiota bacterium]